MDPRIREWLDTFGTLAVRVSCSACMLVLAYKILEL